MRGKRKKGDGETKKRREEDGEREEIKYIRKVELKDRVWEIRRGELKRRIGG